MKREEFMKNMGAAVGALRLSQKMTQKELAKRAKLHHASVVSNIERGDGNPTITTILALAAGLSVKVSLLMKLAEHPQGPMGAMNEL